MAHGGPRPTCRCPRTPAWDRESLPCSPVCPVSAPASLSAPTPTAPATSTRWGQPVPRPDMQCRAHKRSSARCRSAGRSSGKGGAAVTGQQRSAGRDQYAVELESWILAEESDLELLTWEWPGYLGGSPELTGGADAEGIPRVIGLRDERCHRRHIGSGHDDRESVLGGPCRVARWGRRQ